MHKWSHVIYKNITINLMYLFLFHIAELNYILLAKELRKTWSISWTVWKQLQVGRVKN